IKKELTFVLNSCIRYPKNVACSFDVTNDGSAVIDLALHVNCVNEKIRIIDESGNEHLATEGGIGIETIFSGGFGRCFAREKLAPKGTIRGTAKFVSIDQSVNTIKLLTMVFGEAYRGNNFSIQFKDLAITQPAVKRSN